MAESKEMAVREKKELVAKEEKTVPGRYYVPTADIYETDEALAVVLEMPGVEKKDLNINVEETCSGSTGASIFPSTRTWSPSTPNTTSATTPAPSRSGAIDQEKIGANLEDGVLTLTLPKAKHAQPRKIAIE